MINWSDTAVRATVVVVVLNLCLLVAHSVKGTFSDTFVSNTDTMSTVQETRDSYQIDSIFDIIGSFEVETEPNEILAGLGQGDPNCIMRFDWFTLAEDNPLFMKSLFETEAAKPCMYTGITYKSLDTADEIAVASKSDISLVKENGGLSLSCIRTKMSELGLMGDIDRSDLNAEMRKRREGRATVRLLCEIEALTKQGLEIEGNKL